MPDIKTTERRKVENLFRDSS